MLHICGQIHLNIWWLFSVYTLILIGLALPCPHFAHDWSHYKKVIAGR